MTVKQPSSAQMTESLLEKNAVNFVYERRRQSHCHCIVCGGVNPASLRLKFQMKDDGSVWVAFRGQELLQGYSGMMHGGIISTLLDAAMTHCLFHHDIEAVTGELKVRFLHPVPCNARIEVRGWLVESLGILFKMEAEILQEGRQLAKASAKFMVRDS